MNDFKRFMDNVHKINFSPNLERTMNTVLLVSVYDELTLDKTRLEELQKQIQTKKITTDSNKKVDNQLEDYKQKLTENLASIDLQIFTITEEAVAKNINLQESINIDETFINEFAEKFSTLKHMSDTLSDAPQPIKALQTQLYTSILFKLNKNEQEKQISSLTINTIQDMIKQSIQLHDATNNINLQHKCQMLVQSALYEVLQRTCNAVKYDKLPDLSQYQQYQTIIAELCSYIPNVKKSAILDDFSQYRNSNGVSVIDLLTKVEKNLTIASDVGWDDFQKIAAFSERKKLFNLLRFGLDDRKAYVKKIQANLARDLFWARNIQDIELFTTSSISQQTFKTLLEQRYIKQNNLLKPQLITKKLEKIFEQIKPIMKKYFVGKALKGKTVNDKNLAKSTAIVLLKDALTKEFSLPNMNVTENQEIVADVYHIQNAQDLTEKILNSVLSDGGFGLKKKSLLKSCSKHLSGISDRKFSGKTLADIENNINTAELSKEEQESYLLGLKKIQQAVIQSQYPTISALKLDIHEEMLLHQLLELLAVQGSIGNKIKYGESIEQALKFISDGQYFDALKIKNIQTAIKSVYMKLICATSLTLTENIKQIITKVRALNSSTKLRETKLAALEEIFTSQRNTNDKVSAITQIFFKEYQEMSTTLGLTNADENRLLNDIDSMAQETVRLIERTQNGEPALTDDEQAAYFSVIQQIAEKIKLPMKIDNIQLKIKHGSHKVHIKYKDSEQLLDVNLGKVSLPYSLLKQPKADFIFSYGGTRGVIAPFAGLDEAYAGTTKKKGRLFTHSRLLGVGQYGAVKAVEDLLTGINKIIKKGYTFNQDTSQTFTETSRNNKRTRAITARNDQLYRIESDILVNLAKAEKTSGADTVHYWLEDDKQRTKGDLYTKTASPKQYKILAPMARGENFADIANAQLNKYNKGSIEYHNPLKRNDFLLIKDLNSKLSLAQAATKEAEKFQAFGFAHNDIKPENFFYKVKQDGSYEIKYIDWATAGFVQQYKGQSRALNDVFKEIFGHDLNCTPTNDCCDGTNGRFVRKTTEGTINYGVNPNLQILHGSRHGTIPYISPRVLNNISSNTVSDTILKENDPSMDDWALTAMAFGICNRSAYFALVKGRTIGDYVVPGILEPDGKEPGGLRIENSEKFNEFFACPSPFTAKETVSNNDVMFIPANQREGEPLHLYRRLQELSRTIQNENLVHQNPEKQSIIEDINQILQAVYTAVASGEGLNKKVLTQHLTAAQNCIKNYEKLNDQKFKQTLQKTDILQGIFNQITPITADSLLQKINGLSQLEVLCTYPTTKAESAQAANILNTVFTDIQLNDKFLEQHAPGHKLLQFCIAHGKSEIINTLLSKISTKNKSNFISTVRNYGLLHYAAEQHLPDVFNNIIEALKKSGAKNKEIFKLLLCEYGSGKNQIKTSSDIKWSTNCLHIAIRNNDSKQLAKIVSLWPESKKFDYAMKDALIACATIGSTSLFSVFFMNYNLHNTKNNLTTEEIIRIFSVKHEPSPFHLFLKDEKYLNANFWITFKGQLAKDFLLNPPYPAMEAAASSNFKDIEFLIKLGNDTKLTKSEWQEFFKQKDTTGKNLLNFILEQGRIDYLDSFIETLKKNCDFEDLLSDLLCNPHPNNPLENFLTSTDNNEQQFELINTLFNNICEDFTNATVDQQNMRLNTLLTNQSWLISQAENISNHQKLRAFMQNNHALSIPYKKTLFKKLSTSTLASINANVFYKQLLDEVTATDTEPSEFKELEKEPEKIYVTKQNSIEEQSFSNTIASTASLFKPTPPYTTSKVYAPLKISEQERRQNEYSPQKNIKSNLTSLKTTRPIEAEENSQRTDSKFTQTCIDYNADEIDIHRANILEFLRSKPTTQQEKELTVGMVYVYLDGDNCRYAYLEKDKVCHKDLPPNLTTKLKGAEPEQPANSKKTVVTETIFKDVGNTVDFNRNNRQFSSYTVIKELPLDKIRKHRLINDQNEVLGAFIEENTTTKTGKTVTLTKFPNITIEKDACLQLILMMAKQFMVGRTTWSKDNPIVLEGGTREEINYTWMALKTLCEKNDTNFKADDCITVKLEGNDIFQPPSTEFQQEFVAYMTQFFLQTMDRSPLSM